MLKVLRQSGWRAKVRSARLNQFCPTMVSVKLGSSAGNERVLLQHLLEPSSVPERRRKVSADVKILAGEESAPLTADFLEAAKDKKVNLAHLSCQ